MNLEKAKRISNDTDALKEGGRGRSEPVFKNSLISFCSGANVPFPVLDAKKHIIIIIYHCSQNTAVTTAVFPFSKLKKTIF